MEALHAPVCFLLDAFGALVHAVAAVGGEAVAVELMLHQGRCQAAEIRSRDSVSAPFVLTAPYAVWKSVVKGELDPLVGVTRGKIKVQGSLATLMMHAKSAAALCACARNVATAFPDED